MVCFGMGINFVDWLLKNDEKIKVEIETINKDWPYLKNRILSEIANHFWGKDAL